MVKVFQETDSEKRKMYMKQPKKRLIEMLIQCNKHVSLQIKYKKEK